MRTEEYPSLKQYDLIKTTKSKKVCKYNLLNILKQYDFNKNHKIQKEVRTSYYMVTKKLFWRFNKTPRLKKEVRKYYYMFIKKLF